ncbi:MAG: PmoA family protein [Carboxylicivirga sp.]|jgi:hypothetical protein|nr:PmoA family protein [Carboxylicivirga sp.]
MEKCIKIYGIALLAFFFAVSCKQSNLQYIVSKTDTSLILKNKDRDIAVYNYKKICPGDSLPEYYCRGGFIHPLYSPLGEIVTDGFPKGHTHQHALFTAWTKTQFKGETIDFWNQQKKQATVLFKGIDSLYNGIEHCGFISKHEHYSFTHGTILLETWKLKAHAIEDFNVIDIFIEQKNITTDTLFIPNYHYGGIGFRGSKNWNSVDSINYIEKHKIIAANGKSGADANHTRPGWAAMYGGTEKGVAGMAVFCNKNNFMHPQPIRVHHTMPYFSFTPVVDTSFYIAPQAVYKMQYRILTFDNEPNAIVLDSLYNEYNK